MLCWQMLCWQMLCWQMLCSQMLCSQMLCSPDARRASDAGIDLDLGAWARARGPVPGQDRGNPT